MIKSLKYKGEIIMRVPCDDWKQNYEHMRYINIILVALAVACGTKTEKAPEQNEPLTMEEEMKSKLAYTDHHSFSKPSEAVVKHLDWKANVLRVERRFYGKKINQRPVEGTFLLRANFT